MKLLAADRHLTTFTIRIHTDESKVIVDPVNPEVLELLDDGFGRVAVIPDPAYVVERTYERRADDKSVSIDEQMQSAVDELVRLVQDAEQRAAAPEDLTAWAKIPVREANRAFSLAAADLVAADLAAAGPLWTLRRGAARPTPTGVVLVPAFDEYLLGWKDRGFALPAEYAKRIVPGGGIIHPAVLEDGVVIGTWRRTGTELFRDTDAQALRHETQDLTRFL